jgi:IrrE N-terminal-like domain
VDGLKKKSTLDLNAYRRAFIRKHARDLNIDLWRYLQKKAGKSLTAFDILPIDPRLIATEVLGLFYEEPYEIGVLPAQNSRLVEVAGMVERAAKRITVASKLQPTVRRFTGAHEIAHWLIHANRGDLRENPTTDEAVRSQFRSRHEREADLFAADLLMPPKAIEETFSRLFGAPVDGNRIDDNQAFCLTGEKVSAWQMMKLTRDDRAKLIAEAISLTFKQPRSLSEIFGVSASAMAYQLLDLELVS